MTILSQKNGLIYFQAALAIGVIVFFFTFLDSYIAVQQLVISPIGWMLPYFALAIPLFLLKKLKNFPQAVFCWCAGYILLSLISYLSFLPSEPALRGLIDRSFASIFLLVTTYLLINPQVLSLSRIALAVVTGWGVLNNFYQFVNPAAFFGLVDNRVSGLYMDPNDCAYALILGLIFTVGIFPAKFRVPWILLVGLGVAITLSRGGFLSWLLVALLLCLTRIVPYRYALFWISGIGALLLVLIVSETGHSWLNLELDGQMFERANSIINGDTLYDASALERKGILEKAWEMFLAHPIFGAGIGSTSDYSLTGFSVSTHNMFLLHAAEYGLVGLPILPLALYASTYHAAGEARKLAKVFIGFILVGSLFSHTVLDLRSYLIAFAVMAAMSQLSQTNSIAERWPAESNPSRSPILLHHVK